MAKELPLHETYVVSNPDSFSLFLPEDAYNAFERNIAASYSGATVDEIADEDPQEALEIVRTRALEGLLLNTAINTATADFVAKLGSRRYNLVANIIARGLTPSELDSYIPESARAEIFSDTQYHPAPRHNLSIELGRMPRGRYSRGQGYVQTNAGFRHLTKLTRFTVDGDKGAVPSGQHLPEEFLARIIQHIPKGTALEIVSGGVTYRFSNGEWQEK